MIPILAIVGIVFLTLSVIALGYILYLYDAHDRDVATERGRAGLGPLPPAAAGGATPLVGVGLALGGAAAATGLLLLAASFAVLF